MKVSKNVKCNLLETEDNNDHCSILSGGNSFSLALEPCYKEKDIRYKIENVGLQNLNSADSDEDKQKDSPKECRTYCRQLNTHSLMLLESQYGSVRLFKYLSL